MILPIVASQILTPLRTSAGDSSGIKENLIVPEATAPVVSGVPGFSALSAGT